MKRHVTAIFQIVRLLSVWGIIAGVVPKIVLKTSYFGLTLPFIEKQSEYLVVEDRGATYGINYSHETLAKLKKIHILDDFWGIWVVYRKEGPTSNY